MSRPAKVTDLRESRGGNGSDKYSARLQSENRGNCTWLDADPQCLLDAVASVVADGAALLLSKTSDGGALVIQVWTGTQRHKLYPATSTELNMALDLIRDIAQGKQ